MFCTACGTKNVLDANFCKQCGHKLDRTSRPKISEEEFALPESPDEKVKDLLLLAFKKSETEDLEAALQACGEALALRPDSTDAHSLMSTLYEKQGDIEKAVAEREKVLELNPGSIADREKLDQLRDGTIKITPRRIISSRRTAAPALFDSPGGAALAAVAVMMAVMLIGAWVVWAQSRHPRPEQNVRKEQSDPAAAARSPAMQPPAAPQNVAVAPWPNAYPNPYYPYGFYPPVPYPQETTPRRERPSPDLSQMQAQREVPPALVSVPSAGQMERDPRFNEQNNGSNGSGVVHLPDTTGTDQTQPSGGSTTNPASNQVRPNPGRIEIVVSPNGGNGHGGSPSVRPAPGGNTGSGPTPDSRQQRDYARQLQMQNQYQRAITAYIKALDGAGDEAGPIHQQIATCYQRLGENESAIAQYNEAISEYKKLIGAGRNAEAAQRGIRTCEAGIKACQ
jgi:tetratricopeptide (TPR) repeat protein